MRPIEGPSQPLRLYFFKAFRLMRALDHLFMARPMVHHYPTSVAYEGLVAIL